MTQLTAELAYRVIEEGPRSGLRANESHVTLATGPVLFAVDDHGRHLLVPAASESDVQEDRSSRGVQLRARAIGPTHSGARPYIDVVCMQPGLAKVFATFTDDLLSELERQPEKPHHVVPSVLRRWRELLRPGVRPGLSEEKLVGLLGELQVLHELARLDAAGALNSWQGWAGEEWDFLGGSSALEVKSTTKSEGRGFWVHGAGQLNTSAGTDLVVHFRRYGRDDAGGTSVGDALADLTSLGVDDATVRARLAHVGWSPAGNGGEARYGLLESFSWRVDHGFPRIVPDSFVGGAVPERVESLRYWVDLQKPPPAPLLQAEFEGHLTRLAAACR